MASVTTYVTGFLYSRAHIATPMSEIKTTDLVESERNFVENLLDIVERELSFDGTNNIPGSHEYSPSALEPLIEAEQMIREADGGVEVTGKDGNLIDVDLKLAVAQIDYKNDVAQLKRNLGIANELSVILDIIDRVTLDKENEYYRRVTELRISVEKAITDLNEGIATGEKVVEEINKSTNPLDRSIIVKHEK